MCLKVERNWNQLDELYAFKVDDLSEFFLFLRL